MKFKVGDMVALSPTDTKYKVTIAYGNGTYRAQDMGSGFYYDMDLVSYELHSEEPTHSYKVGDIIAWNSAKSSEFEIIRVRETPNTYDLKGTVSGRVYKDEEISGNNYLVSSASKPASTIPSTSEKCKWAIPQQLDIEPIYYRVYKDGSSPGAQHESSNILVIKRAQALTREIPSCNITDQPVYIIGVSTADKNRQKAEAFLQCMECKA